MSLVIKLNESFGCEYLCKEIQRLVSLNKKDITENSILVIDIRNTIEERRIIPKLNIDNSQN